MTGRFPDGTVRQVVVLRYGDDPEIESGALIVRLVLMAAGGANGGEEAIDAFSQAHGEAFGQLRKDLTAEFPGLWKLEALADGDTGG